MKLFKNMNSTLKYVSLVLCIAMALSGCSPASRLIVEEAPVENKAHLDVGKNLSIDNKNENLILHDYKEALAGDGLYYAAWHIGDAKPYENSDSDTVDLYDAQLYLLLGEFTNGEKALENKGAWIETGRNNYEISEEKELSCGGLDYLIITYTFKNKENPYARGVSAFTVHDKYAVCVELTCQEEFGENLEAILTGFLEGMTFN